MSPRPRTVSDAAILDATRRLMGELGPTRFTLAAVATEVGLAPATLVQRFGSKRGLLLAVADPGGEDPSRALVAQLRARHRSPLARLRGFLAGFAALGPSPAVLANNLAFLQIDLTDPDFHAVALRVARANEAEVEALVREAIDAGELRRAEPRPLARALLAVSGGALLSWGILREGSARDSILRDVDLVLAGWRRKPGDAKPGNGPESGPG